MRTIIFYTVRNFFLLASVTVAYYFLSMFMNKITQIFGENVYITLVLLGLAGLSAIMQRVLESFDIGEYYE